MKTKILAISALACLLAGCATPSTRIASDPEAFARLNPDQQAMVRAGRIGVGYPVDAVKMALGSPDRVTINADAQGQSETWHYMAYAYVQGPWLYVGGGPGFRHGGWSGGWGGWGPWWDQPAYAYDHFRVDFRNGVVTSFSQEVP